MNKKEFVFDISPLSSADILEVKILEQECNLSPWSVNDYYAEAGRKDSITLGARIKGKVVGFIVARLITTDRIKEIEIEVFNICVARDFRRAGIGRALICKLIAATENIVTTVWLEVRESNQKAISFYEALGFGITGKRNNFYHDPQENGLIMRKVI